MNSNAIAELKEMREVTGGEISREWGLVQGVGEGVRGVQYSLPSRFGSVVPTLALSSNLLCFSLKPEKQFVSDFFFFSLLRSPRKLFAMSQVIHKVFRTGSFVALLESRRSSLLGT